MSRVSGIVCSVLALSMAGCASTPKPETCAGEAPSLALMNQLIERFNARDTPGWDATFHYPHVLSAPGRVVLFSDPAQQANTIPQLVQQGWVRSEWGELKVLQCAATKAHVSATFVRYRADGSVLSATRSIYAVENRGGRWGVTMRSLLPT